jgi:flagellar basal-body rod protein FlgB
LYRIPEQPSVDGNTVDSRIEQAEFAENALEYQASLTLLSRKFNGLRTAIRGE